MDVTRRFTLWSLLASPVVVTATQEQTPDSRLPIPKLDSEDPDKRLPNGKLQRDAIVKQQHVDALKDADALVMAAEELRDELKRAGEYVIPVTSVKKTEEIEKLAKKIRARLKN